MTQPELGKKIAEIRKQKGFTQEELVEKCNVTVRTLQRIEAGDVLPRSSTLRLLIEAMDYDWNSFSSEHAVESDSAGTSLSANWFGRFFGSAGSPKNRSLGMQLQWAWIAGIFYFILGFPEAMMEFKIISADFFPWGVGGYVVIKVLVIISFTFMFRGFILIGQRQRNTLLTLSSWIFMFVLAIDYSMDIFSLLYERGSPEEVLIGKALMYGFTAIFFGIALTRIEQPMGLSARFAGILEIVIGISFLTVIFFIVGMFLMIPAELLEIYILFKYGEKIRENLDTKHA